MGRRVPAAVEDSVTAWKPDPHPAGSDPLALPGILKHVALPSQLPAPALLQEQSWGQL